MLTILSLLGAAIAFLAADAIEERRFKREVKSLAEDLTQIREVLNAGKEQVRSIAQATYAPGTMNPELLRLGIEDYRELIQSLQDGLASSSQEELEGRLLTLVQEQSERTDARVMLSALSTRIGSVFLLIFLVQILVGMYRYNARMLAHFEGRADMFEILGAEVGSSMKDHIALLETNQVDFGKEPTSPAQRLFDGAKEVLKRGS